MASYFVRIERQTRELEKVAPMTAVPALRQSRMPFRSSLGSWGIQNHSGMSASLVTTTPGGDTRKRDGEVGLEDLLDAGVLHDGLRHLALPGGGRLDPLQALPHLRKPRLEAVGHRLLVQRLADHLADGLVEVGGALEGVEERCLVNLGVGLNQAATEFGESVKFYI